MGKETEIGWVNRVLADGRTIPGATFNVVWGCEKVSPACRSCYAQTWANRMGYDIWGKNAPRRVLSENYWKQPLAWNRKAAGMGEVKLVFCSSMADVFEDHPTVNQERQKLWELIDATPWLTWLLLTKRPQNIKEMYPPLWLKAPPHNVWLGTSVENQKFADKRLPKLLSVKAVVRFLSCEPLLGPLDLLPWLSPRSFDQIMELDKRNPQAAEASKEIFGIYERTIEVSGKPYTGRFLEPETTNWIIAGGESGALKKIRPMEQGWALRLREQAKAADVPFYMKQMGSAYTGGKGKGAEEKDIPASLFVREIPEPIKPGQQLAML